MAIGSVLCGSAESCEGARGSDRMALRSWTTAQEKLPLGCSESSLAPTLSCWQWCIESNSARGD